MSLALNIRLRQAYFSDAGLGSSAPRKSCGMSNGQWNTMTRANNPRIPKAETLVRITVALQLPGGALTWPAAALVGWCEANPLAPPAGHS